MDPSGKRSSTRVEGLGLGIYIGVSERRQDINPKHCRSDSVVRNLMEVVATC